MSFCQASSCWKSAKTVRNFSDNYKKGTYTVWSEPRNTLNQNSSNEIKCKHVERLNHHPSMYTNHHRNLNYIQQQQQHSLSPKQVGVGYKKYCRQEIWIICLQKKFYRQDADWTSASSFLKHYAYCVLGAEAWLLSYILALQVKKILEKRDDSYRSKTEVRPGFASCHKTSFAIQLTKSTWIIIPGWSKHDLKC
jgi:hypothetical protein